MPTLKQIAAARKVVAGLKFGTTEWESAMQVVRGLVAKYDAAQKPEVFCSIDSGVHPTRLSDGRIIGR